MLGLEVALNGRDDALAREGAGTRLPLQLLRREQRVDGEYSVGNQGVGNFGIGDDGVGNRFSHGGSCSLQRQADSDGSGSQSAS